MLFNHVGRGGGKLKSKANWFSWTWFTFYSNFALILLNVIYLFCCLLSPMDLHLFGLIIISLFSKMNLTQNNCDNDLDL